MSRLVRSDAIVLRAVNLRETSLVVTFLTKDYGKVSLVAKGVKTKKNLLFSHFDLFSLINLVFYFREDRDLQLWSDSALIEHHSLIRSDLEKLCAAQYMVELVDAVTQPHQPQQDLFVLLDETLRSLSLGISLHYMSAFEVKVLSLVGFAPTLDTCAACHAPVLGQKRIFSISAGGVICDKEQCRQKAGEALVICAGTIESIKFLRANTYNMIDRFKWNGQVDSELHKVIERFLQYHIHHGLKSRKILSQIRSHILELPEYSKKNR